MTLEDVIAEAVPENGNENILASSLYTSHGIVIIAEHVNKVYIDKDFKLDFKAYEYVPVKTDIQTNE